MSGLMLDRAAQSFRIRPGEAPTTARRVPHGLYSLLRYRNSFKFMHANLSVSQLWRITIIKLIQIKILRLQLRACSDRYVHHVVPAISHVEQGTQATLSTSLSRAILKPSNFRHFCSSSMELRKKVTHCEHYWIAEPSLDRLKYECTGRWQKPNNTTLL